MKTPLPINRKSLKAFLKALSRGLLISQYKNPDEAADILLTAVPELDTKLVKASQEWISPYYPS